MGGSSLREALLDTGADDTVFPESVAVALGIDLSNAPTAEATGIGTGTGTLRYAPVTLEITDGNEIYKWTALVAFTSLLLRTPLLGFAGCLQYFTATFDGHAERVTLEANALLPGVV
jgi:predicted aspartyl protease